MTEPDREIEAYLRRFRPVRPRPFEPQVQRPRVWQPWLRAAAVVVLAGGTLAVWLSVRSPTTADSADGRAGGVPLGVGADMGDRTSMATLMTQGQLARIARGGLDDLDAALTAASLQLLPDVDRIDGAFHVLAEP